MATYTNKDGTNANDTLTYNQGGSKVIYHAGKGNDIIKITGGTLVNVYTDGGNNTISVTGGSQHTIRVAATDEEGNTIAGIDKLTINGANCVDASLGSGKDEITMSNTNGRKSTGALSQIRGGNWGDTFVINSGSLKYQLYGELGDDIFTVIGGSDLNLWGGAGRDTFELKGGTNNKVYGGDSEDTFNVRADKQYVVLGYGGNVTQRLYDTVNVYSGNNQTVLGNLGINQINLYAGSNHIVKADIDKALSKKNGYTDAQINAGIGLGYGVDNILIQGANYVTANTGDGKDVVIVKGGTGHRIYTEGWGDTIKISNSVKDSIFDAGAGKDTYEVEWRYLGSGNIIDQRSAGANDNDIVKITDMASTKFSFSIEDIDFIITEKSTQKQLRIRGWGNGINSITFSDKTLTGTEFFKELIIDDGADHGEVKLGLPANNTIDGYTVKVVDGSAHSIVAGFDNRNPETADMSVKYTAKSNSVIVSAEGKVHADATEGLDGSVKAVQLVSGTASSNTVTLNNGLVEGDFIAAQVEQGSANSNTATVSGGTANDIYGAKGRNVELTGNKVVMSAGEVNNVYGASAEAGTVSSNSVSLNGGTAARVYGGNGDSTSTVDGNSVTISGSGNVMNAVYGGKSANQAASNNTVLVQGNSTVQDVYGGYSTAGAAMDNSVTLAGNSVVNGDVYINYTESGTTGDGTAIIKDKAEIKGTVYGGSGVDTIQINWGKVNNISSGAGADAVTVTNGTVNTIATGADDDSVTVSNGTVGEIIGGAGNDTITINGGTVTKIDGEGGNNTIIVTGGKVEQLVGGTAGATIEVTGGTVNSLEGGTQNDSITINGGTVTAITGGAGRDTITLNGGTVGLVDAGSGQDTISIAWNKITSGTVINQRTAASADDDLIQITDANSTDFTFSLAGDVLTITDAKGKKLIVQGWGNGTNSITFADKKLTGTEFFKELEIADGQQHGEVKLGLPVEGSVSGYTVKLTNGTANSVRAAYENGSGAAELTAENNLIVVGSQGQVVADSALSLEGNAIAAELVNGTANSNRVELKGGTVEGVIIGAQVLQGAADSNTVAVQSGSAQDIYGAMATDAALTNNEVNILGGSVHNAYGAASVQGDVSCNKVQLSGGTVQSVYGGYGEQGSAGETAALVHENTVSITGGTVAENVYGGYSHDGNVSANSVALGGTAIIEGDVYANYSANGVTGAGEITVSDSANLKGSIYGGQGIDTITIENGTVAAISSGAGDDIIDVQAGTVGSISGGAGADSIQVSGGVVTTIAGDSGANTVTVSGGEVGTINGGNDEDTVIVNGGTIGTIDTGEGQDHITIDWNNLSGNLVIDQTSAGTSDNDIIRISGVDSIEFSFTLESGVLTISDSQGKELEILGWEQGTNSITFDDKTLTGDDFFPSKELVINDSAAHGEIKWGTAADKDLEEYSVKLMSGSTTGIYVAYDKNAADDFSNNVNARKNSLLIGVQGSVLANTSAGLPGNVRAAYVVNGSASENIITMNGGSVAGTVAAAQVVKGDACDNTIILKGTSLIDNDGYVVGGITDNGAASRNSIEISSKFIDLHSSSSSEGDADKGKGYVAGGQTKTGNAEDNTITLTAGTYHSVYGGRQYAQLEGCDVSELDMATITTRGNVMGNTTVVGGKARINAYAYGGKADIGNAENNEVSIGEAGELEGVSYAAPVVFKAYGGFSSWGNAKNNKVAVYGDAEVNTAIAGGSESSSGFTVGNNTLTVSGNAVVTQAIGGYGNSGEACNATVIGNKVLLQGGTVSKAYGADVAKYKGQVSGNSVIMSGGSALELVGAIGRVMAETMDGTVSSNTVTLTGATVASAIGGNVVAGTVDEEVYQGIGLGDASGNTVNIGSAGVVTQTVIGGQTEFGSATGNAVVLESNAQAKKVVGGISYAGAAAGNQVTIKDTAKVTASSPASIIGGLAAKGSTGVAENNSILISGNAVVDNVYGGSNENCLETTGSVNSNEVNLSGNAHIKGNVVGGLVDYGTSSGNRVLISGFALVDGNVYSSLLVSSEHGTTGDGEISISDSATIQGIIYGGDGVDTINILGGTVENIESGAGADAITVSDGRINIIKAGADADIIVVEDGTIASVEGEAGADTITVSGGSVTTIDGGLDGDTISINGGEIGNVSGGAGSDTITVTAGNITSLSGGADGDSISISGGTVETINAGAGNDLITIDWNSYEGGTLIDQSSAAADENDKLVLNGVEPTDLTYSFKKNILTIADSAGKQLFIKGWTKGFASIYFGDREFTEDDMFPEPVDDKALILNDGADRGEVVWGTTPAAGEISGYTVKLKNGSTSDLYAAKGTSSNVTDNIVVISGGQATGNVYAGYTETGVSENNSVSVTRNGVIKGDIYANYSVSGTVGASTVEISDEATVEGTIVGGTGVDTVSVYGGTVNAIATAAGNDVVTVDGGQVAELSLGAGDDTLTMASGSITNVIINSGTNTITAQGGVIEELAISGGTNTVDIQGGTITNINNATGSTSINVSAGELTNIDLSQNRTTVSVTGGNVENVRGTTVAINQAIITVGANNSTVTVTDGTVHNIYGSTTLTATGADLDTTTLHGGAEADTITVSSSTLGAIATGAGNDTVNIQNNSLINQLLLEAGNNTVKITSSEVKGVDGTLGEDSITLNSSQLEVTAGAIEALVLSGGNNSVTVNGSSIVGIKGGTDTDQISLIDGNIEINGYGTYNVDMVSGTNTAYLNNTTYDTLNAYVSGGSGEDTLTVGKAKAYLVDGDIEHVYLTNSSGEVIVNGANVDAITVDHTSEWSSTNIAINSGYVGRIDASTSSVNVNVYGGILGALEGAEIKGDNNSVKVGKAYVVNNGGEIQSFAASGTVKLQSITVDTPIVGTEADNTMTIIDSNVTYLESGLGDDTISISRSNVETLKLNGGNNTAVIGVATSSWQSSDEDISNIENLILEGDTNKVDVKGINATITNIVANGKRDMVNITGGTVTITEGTVEVLGLNESKQAAKIILDGGNIGFLCSTSSNAKMAEITILNGSIGGICGAYANSTSIRGAKMSLSDTDSLGEVSAGYANGEDATKSCIANANTLNLANCANIEAVYSGKAENVSGLYNTSAVSNEVNITGDTQIGTIYAGYVDGAFTGVDNSVITFANYNKVNLKDSTAAVSIDAIYAGYSKDTGLAPNYGAKSKCQNSYNKVEISVKNATIGTICAGFSDNAPGRVTLNEVNITGSAAGSLVVGSVYGGKATNTGISGLTYMAGNQNKVNISAITSAENIYGCYADSAAEAILNNVVINGCGEVQNVYGGYADCASAQYADVQINGGTSIGKVYGAYSSGVNLGVTFNNKVSVNNVASIGTVYGAYSDLNCTYAAYGNNTYLTDCTISRIYVGYNVAASGEVHQSATNGTELPSSDGGTEMNLVAVLGASTVTGDVNVNYASGYGNANNNMFYLGGSSRVQGSIVGNSLIDIIGIAGGTAGTITTNAGNDKVRVTAGAVDSIDGGAGSDYLFVTGGSVKKLQGGAGADTIVVDYSNSEEHNGVAEIVGDTATRADNDIIVVKGSYAADSTAANTINAGGGDDYVKLEGDYCKGIYGGNGNDVIELMGSSCTINGDAGADVIKINNSRDSLVKVGNGNDTVVIDTSYTISNLQIDYAAGTDQADILLKGANVSEVSAAQTNGNWKFTYGNDDFTIINDQNHVTILYCEDGYLAYDSATSSYTAYTAATSYSGDALTRIAAAETAFTTAESSLATFDDNFFTDSELKVSGNS